MVRRQIEGYERFPETTVMDTQSQEMRLSRLRIPPYLQREVVMQVGDNVKLVKDLSTPEDVDYVPAGTVGIVHVVSGYPFPYTVDFNRLSWLVNADEIQPVDSSTQG
jgi:hypothetical protein